MMVRRVFLRLGVLASLCAVASLPAMAQDKWPMRPVKTVIPFAPGGTTDLVTRIVATPMSETLGQQFMIENKAGGGGAIGADAVAKASKDGYTLGIGTVSTHAIGPALAKTPLYDVQADFVPISVIATTPIAIFAHPSAGATLAELIEKARANPGKLNFGSPGNGTLGHLAGIWFNKLAGIELTHVPYRGSGPALQDLLSGRIHVMFDNIPAPLPHVKAGTLRALAVTAPSRVDSLPNVPTSAEAGLPEFEVLSWTLLLGPKGTPPHVVATANAALNKALGDETVRSRFAEVGADARGGSAADAEKFLQAELAKWVPLAKASGVVTE